MTFDATTLEAARRLAEVEAGYFSKTSPRRAPPASVAKAVSYDLTKTPEQPAPRAPSIPSNEQLLAEYERSTELQHEFVNFTDFAAFKRAEARGAFRLLRRVA